MLLRSDPRASLVGLSVIYLLNLTLKKGKFYPHHVTYSRGEISGDIDTHFHIAIFPEVELAGVLTMHFRTMFRS